MPKSQQPPSVVDNQLSPNDEKDEVATLRSNGAPKPHIGRSNSAPQVQNRFGFNRQGLQYQLSPGGRISASKRKQLPTEELNILTLSDGVLHVNHEQAAHTAAHVLSAHELIRQSSVGGGFSNNSTSLSSPSVYDMKHLPAQNVLDRTSFVHNQNVNPNDVWQYRETFPVSDQMEASRQHMGTPGRQHQGHGNIPSSRAGKHDQISSARNSAGNITPQAYTTNQTVTNGTYTRENGKESQLETMSYEMENSHLSSSDADIEWSDFAVRRQHQNYPSRLAQSEMNLPSDTQRKKTLASVKEKGYARLEEELMKAQKALEMKDEEVDELRGIRERLMKEVSDFTASLFEEVNSQLNEAATNEQQARKQLTEANAKIEVLSAEVSALKDLVLTSTPSSPNKHLHPQIDTSSKKDKEGKPFWKTHRRSTSHHQFTKESREKAEANEHHSLLKELDTGAFDEFQRWSLQPSMEFIGQFFTRVQHEDIQPCLNFKNKHLADKLLESVASNSLSIEPIPGDHSYPRKCCLSESHKLCNYKIRFEGDDEWYSISQMSRNRIAAVCDFYSYLRYIVQGLVKCSDKDMFAELVRLRNKMAQARLGLI